MKIKNLSSFFLAVLVVILSGCAVSKSPDLTPKATLVGRYALNPGAGVAEIVAYHYESRSIFMTVDTPTAPSSFQRISLAKLSSTALANPITASNLTAGSVISVAPHVNGNGFTVGGVQTLAITGNLMAIAVQASPKSDLGVVAFYKLDAQGNAT